VRHRVHGYEPTCVVMANSWRPASRGGASAAVVAVGSRALSGVAVRSVEG